MKIYFISYRLRYTLDTYKNWFHSKPEAEERLAELLKSHPSDDFYPDMPSIKVENVPTTRKEFVRWLNTKFGEFCE